MQLLIAHQDPAARATIAKAFAEDGQRAGRDALDVVQSGDGHEALDLLLGDEPPRLAVLDLDLPGIDGAEICRLVRDFHLGGPPYIVMLAASAHADLFAVLEAGANDCIRMPAPVDEIHERVAAGMDLVRVPWEKGDRVVALEAMRAPESGKVGSAYFEKSEPSCPVASREAAADLESVIVPS